MGFLSRLGRWQLDDGVAADARPVRAAWTTLGGSADLAQVRDLPPGVAAAFGLNPGGRPTRDEAMKVPAIRRGRAIVAGTLGAQPLIAHRTDPDGRVVDVTATPERQLIRQPDPSTTLQYVLTWTVDDLMFYGASWWRRLAKDSYGYPVRAERIAPHRVFADVSRGRVYVDGVHVPDDELIRFDGPDEGILAYGEDVIATARILDAAVRRNADGLPPLDLLRPAEGAPELSLAPGSYNPEDPTDDRNEVEGVLDAWREARRRRSTAFLNRAVEHQSVGFDPDAIALVDQRREQRAELANLLNLSPRYVNAPSGDSMTYSSTTAERSDLADLSFAGYRAAIEQRLSMGDVTPRGTVVRFDLSRFLQGDPTTALANAEKAKNLGATDAAEIRADVLGRPPLEGNPTA